MTLEILERGESRTVEVPPGAVLNLLPGSTAAQLQATLITRGVDAGPYLAVGDRKVVGPFPQLVSITIEALMGRSGIDVSMPSISTVSSVPMQTSTFYQAIAGYKTLQDYAFGTSRKLAGVKQIASVADLATDWDYYAYNLYGPTTVINSEWQRYKDFTHAANFVFATDALELTGTLPNGTPNLKSTTVTSAVANSRTITVADASSIAQGQVLSFGPTGNGTLVNGLYQNNQYANLVYSRIWGVVSTTAGGTVTAGDTLKFTATPDSGLGIGTTPIVLTYMAIDGDTFVSMTTAMVSLINNNATLKAFNVTATQDPTPGVGILILNMPKLSAAQAPQAYGASSAGSTTYFSVSMAGTGTTTIGGQEFCFLTWVLSKNGNVLTLNQPVTASAGQTLFINYARRLTRNITAKTTGVTFQQDASASGVTPVVPAATFVQVSDTSNLVVGQATSVANQDSNFGFITSISANTQFVTNRKSSFSEGTYMTTYPVWGCVPSQAYSSVNTMKFPTASFPASVTVGMQFVPYSAGTQTINNDTKVVSITNNGDGTTTVVLSAVSSLTASQYGVFYEALDSAQIWSRWGVVHDCDGYTNIAFEMEGDFPDPSNVAAWAAFWQYSDPTNPTGLAANPLGLATGYLLNEIDMLEQYNYFGNATTGDYRPSAAADSTKGTAITYAYGTLSATPLPGNNLLKGAKIQCISTQRANYFYLNGTLMFVQTFYLKNDYRKQIAVNLALGCMTSISNGFFPIDQSMFPMKCRVKRIRVWGAAA